VNLGAIEFLPTGMPGNEILWLAVIALFAAVINGALGYGFSSITVPLALLFLTSRILNPALVLVEIGINLYVLAISWRSAAAAARRTAAILLGLLPGVLLGSRFLATLSPEAVKLFTYVVLLPLILMQAGGLRRPFRAERALGLPFGVGVGLLYSLTTVSGPPLAVWFNNQGYAKQEFRASLAVVRVAESSMTAAVYASLGLLTPQSLALIPSILVPVLVGVPLGTLLIRRIDAETFRRICMSFDAWIVGFGLSRVLGQMRLAPERPAYLVLALVVAIDALLLVRYFRGRSRLRLARSELSAPPTRDSEP
jgi:uncharacterized membrane protein YfcA